MARKVFQSDDLLRIIYGFGDPEHRQTMKVIHTQLLHPLSKLPAQYPYSGFETHDQCMKDLLTNFFQLRRCMCCTRHAHNKPNLYLTLRHGLSLTVESLFFRNVENWNRVIAFVAVYRDILLGGSLTIVS